MKRLFFVIIALLFCVHYQCASAQDTADLTYFFKYKNFMPAKPIIQLFDPGDEIMNIRVDASRMVYTVKDRIVVRDSVEAVLTLNCENQRLTVGLYYAVPNTFFYKINVFGDEVHPATGAALKSFENQLRTKFTKGEIAWVEKKSGKSISNMDAKELCLAYLNMQYWKTDIKKLRYGY